jgi:exodeoxyribonuclease VII small subunit
MWRHVLTDQPSSAQTNEGPKAPLNLELCGLDRPAAEIAFEDLVEALEQVAGRLANGELGIEAAVELYEQAELLHELARERLASVQARIDRLTPP